MTDKRGRVALQKILEDFNKLAENEFWHTFLRFIEDEAQRTLRELAKEEYQEQKIRYWQGKYSALKLVASQEKNGFTDRILKETRREIDK